MRLFPSLVVAALLSACSVPPLGTPPGTVVVEGFTRPPKGATVVVLPPHAEYPEFAAGEAPVEEDLALALAAAGYKPRLVERGDFSVVWKEEVAAVGGLFDPVTGAPKAGHYERAVGRVARRISVDLPGALYLNPRLVLRTATFEGSSIEWDGQRRPPPMTDDDFRAWRASGTTRGLSVQLTAVTPDGTLRFQTYGGLVLPYSFNVMARRAELRRDLFVRRSEITEGSRAALSPLLSGR